MTWVGRIIAYFRIPAGEYCYFGVRFEGRWCPYYREFWPTEDWGDHISYCGLIDKSDCDGLFLLHDQVKECGVKMATRELEKEER